MAKPTDFFGGKYIDKSVLVCADSLGVEVEKIYGNQVAVTFPRDKEGSSVSVVTKGSGSYYLLVMLKEAYEKGLAT